MKRAVQSYRVVSRGRTGQPLPALARATIVAAGLWFSVSAAATVVTVWNQAALTEVTPVSKIGPPVIARALAIAHTCMYDAWSVYDATAAATLGNTPRRPASERTDTNKAKAISYAAYNCLLNLFPAGASRLSAVMTGLGYDPNDTSTDLTTPQGIGNVAAARVIHFRRDDGSNQYGNLSASGVPYSDYTGYSPRNPPLAFCSPLTVGPCPQPNITGVLDPLHWQPLISSTGSTQAFISPFWERVTPFALTSATEYDNQPGIIPPPHIQQGPAPQPGVLPLPNTQPTPYQSDVLQMVQYSSQLELPPIPIGNTVACVPQLPGCTRKLIVEYWADGPNSVLPPGHWGVFAQYVSARDQHSIDQDVQMFFALHNASFDASIVGWHTKRMYDGVRPITAARYVAQGAIVTAWGGPGQPIESIPAEKWIPYNPGSNLTPSFPGYFSGHSVFSRSSATVLQLFTGSDTFGYSAVIPANIGRVEPGIPSVPTTLTYPTFSFAAEDAGMSRLYGGIHFSDDNDTGQRVGALIGQQAWAQAQLYFAGLIALDNTSNATSTNATTLSWSHTVGTANNSLLLVGISCGNGSSVLGLTYGGQPLRQRIVQNGPGNQNRVELWYLLAPPSGTANVVATLANAAHVVGGAASFTAVNQSRPFGESVSASGQGTAASLNVSDTSGDQVIFSIVAANEGANPMILTGGQTATWNNGSGTTSADILGAAASGAGAESGVPVSYTLATSQPWALGAVALKPALARMGLPH